MAGCVFCVIVEGASVHFVHEGPLVVAFLDHAPLIPGHVLVAPRAHHETLEDVPEELLAPVFGLAQVVSRAQRAALGADGSLTMANTRVSQSVPHAHVHVVPRRRNDGLFRAGMVWVRRRYREGEAAEIAARLRTAISASD
ncbi:MAG TPA: HIT family protein [Candidatus Limnocylindrales bacterium]|nr:HIT family protein [Candidatus Limnocylindrales bacterium]